MGNTAAGVLVPAQTIPGTMGTSRLYPVPYAHMPIALHIAHTAFVGTYDTTVLGVSYAYAYVIRSWRMTDDRPSTASSVTTAGGKLPYLMVESITTHISQEHLIDGNGNVTSAEPFFSTS